LPLAGAISFSTADIVGGFAVKDGKLTRHSALSPGLETSEPKIKFGKDGEANTIRVGLSQNAPDSLVLDVYVSFSIYLSIICFIYRTQRKLELNRVSTLA
jgi:hypothetical protein